MTQWQWSKHHHIFWEFLGHPFVRFAPRSGLSSHCWMVSSTSYRLIYNLLQLLLGRITSSLLHVSDYITTCDLQDFAEDTSPFFVCPKKRYVILFQLPRSSFARTSLGWTCASFPSFAFCYLGGLGQTHLPPHRQLWWRSQWRGGKRLSCSWVREKAKL